MPNGTLSIAEYSRGVVKIIGKKIKFNWVNPSQKSGEQSIGSGFFIDQQGHILTAAHVVSECLEVMIKIPNLGKNEFPVQVLGVCFDLDIALLKADPQQIPGNIFPFPLGGSDQVQIGERAHAVGFPLNQDQLSVTDGIISSRQSGGYFQTNADLNPGNSGGPLFKDGKVIGINIAIMRGSNGIGYAVPIAMYQLIEEELKQPNQQKTKLANLVRRPNLNGIGFTATNPSLNKLFNSQCHESGIYIILVSPGSPFDQVGLKPGHILCSINNKKIDYHGMIQSDYNPDEKVQVHEVFNKVKNGQKIPIIFWDGYSMVTKELTAIPWDAEIREQYPIYEQIDYEIFGGLVVMQLALNHLQIHPEYTQRLFKFTERKNRYQPRLVITDVYPTSEFARLETFSKGDIINKVNNREVYTLEDFRKAITNPIQHQNEYYISIEDEMGCLGVMTANELLTQEQKLNEQYDYKSNLFHILAQKVNFHHLKPQEYQQQKDDSEEVLLSQGDTRTAMIILETPDGQALPIGAIVERTPHKTVGGSLPQPTYKSHQFNLSKTTPYKKSNFLC